MISQSLVAFVSWHKCLVSTGITMEHGYLPFTVLREDLLNIPWLQAVPSRCWRCKNPWTIVGVQASLGYFVGNCECLYDT